MILEKNYTQFDINKDEDELVMIIELFRHGARRELIDYEGTRPFPDNHFGKGDLTTVGMKEHYLLGKQIKEIHKDFLGDKPNYKEVVMEASNSNRCLISAQSHLMGIFDLGSGSEVESDQHKPPFIGYSDHSKSKNALPHKHSVYPIINNTDNILFDVYQCKITRDVVDKGFERMDRKYFKVFKSLYDNLDQNGYRVRDIFGEDNWNIQRANSICDWIFTRLYYFDDFEIDQKLKNQCQLLMTFDNFSRYKDKLYFKTFSHPINNKILKILNDKIKNKSKPTKLHILSGHDDNVSTFLMNFKYDNNDCIAKEFDQLYNDGQNLNDFKYLFCFDHLLFTTNVILQLVKNQSQYYIKMLYNGGEALLERSRFTLKDFTKTLNKNIDKNFEQNCYQNAPDNSIRDLLLVITLLLITLIIYSIFRHKTYNKI